MGRPTKMTPETLDKLRQAFLIGATNLEAAHYAGITEKTLYNYIEKHPEYLQVIDALKSEPILKAKQTVVKGLDDIKNSQWYLERKAKAEFAQRQELTGNEGAAINVIIEDTYAKQPKFRTDNNNAEADDLAEDSSR